MKRILIYYLAVIFLTSCSHRIARSGYEKQKVSENECEVVIQKDITIPATVATVVGEITLGESGLSFACSEEIALETLKREACSVNADLILITQEKRPDFWSSCYRCKAEFYRILESDNKELFTSSPDFHITQVQERVKDDRVKNVFRAITAAFAGYLAGALLF